MNVPKADEMYMHYQGAVYKIIGSATHTETNEILVIYRPVDCYSFAYARPLAHFQSEILLASGEKIPRFRKLPDNLRRTLR